MRRLFVYRFHDTDPILVESALWLTCTVSALGGGKLAGKFAALVLEPCYGRVEAQGGLRPPYGSSAAVFVGVRGGQASRSLLLAPETMKSLRQGNGGFPALQALRKAYSASGARRAVPRLKSLYQFPFPGDPSLRRRPDR